MSSPDTLEALLARRMAAAVSGLVPDVDLGEIRRRGHRALAWRRSATLAGFAVTAVVLGAVLAPRTEPIAPGDDGSRTASLAPAPSTSASAAPSPLDSTPSSAAPGARTMPDLAGLPYAEAEALLAADDVDRYRTVWIASPDVPRDHVIAQDPAGGAPVANVTLTFSTGGPTIDEDELPAPAQELVRDRLAPGEEVLVVQTPAGTAYKVDALLFGPCAAVDAAYRTFLDPVYVDACY